MKTNHLAKVKLHLLQGKSLTSWQAITWWRNTRLSAYIHKLKREHRLPIESEDIKKDGKVYSRYFIPRKPKVNRITDGSYKLQAELKR